MLSIMGEIVHDIHCSVLPLFILLFIISINVLFIFSRSPLYKHVLEHKMEFRCVQCNKEYANRKVKYRQEMKK